ncbi:hypothetical protein QUB33_23115 [Microcoleus sp. B3-A4]
MHAEGRIQSKVPPNTVPDGLLSLITLMFPAKSLTLNAGFWLKNPVFQPQSVISTMIHIHPDNQTMQRSSFGQVGMNGGPVEL